MGLDYLILNSPFQVEIRMVCSDFLSDSVVNIIKSLWEMKDGRQVENDIVLT